MNSSTRSLMTSYLEEDNQKNNIILSELGIMEHRTFCTNAYGYGAGIGVWPEYVHWDMEAVSRVLLALEEKGVIINVL